MSTLKVNALQDTSGKGFYPARAWANLNGAGTVSIRGDGGVSSITDNAVGKYTVNLDNSMSNTNYGVSLGQAEDSYYAIMTGLGNAGHTLNTTTSSFRTFGVYGSTYYDLDVICVNVNGDM